MEASLLSYALTPSKSTSAKGRGEEVMASLPSEDLVFLSSIFLTRECQQLVAITTDLAVTVLFR